LGGSVHHLLIILLCIINLASCVESDIEKQRDPLVEELRQKMDAIEWYQNLDAELAWLKEMPPLDRLADDLRKNKARFLTIFTGWGNEIPGLKEELTCLAPYTSRHYFMIGDYIQKPGGEILEYRETFMAKYNDALARYLIDLGLDCKS